MKLTTGLFVILAAASTAFPQQKKTISIDDFAYSAVLTSVQSIFGNEQISVRASTP